MTTNKTNKGRLFSYRKQMIKKNIKQSNHLVKVTGSAKSSPK